MVYLAMAWLHAQTWRAGEVLRNERGQGTVEYVGLMLMLGVLLAGVVAAAAKANGGGLDKVILAKLKGAIETAFKR